MDTKVWGKARLVRARHARDATASTTLLSIDETGCTGALSSAYYTALRVHMHELDSLVRRTPHALYSAAARITECMQKVINLAACVTAVTSGVPKRYVCVREDRAACAAIYRKG